MANFFNKESEENEEDQFKEGFINRNAILVKPHQAFWDWLKKEDKIIETLNQEKILFTRLCCCQ